MQVFGFDLLPYPEHLDQLKVDGELPYPLPKKHFRAALAVSNYREHLDAWALMEALGFDGIGFNEHHTSPYGLMTSPNIMAAAGPYTLYFFHTLFSHGNLYNVGGQRQSGYVREEGLGWLRPENREDFLRALQGFRKMTQDDLKRSERLCWGSPAQVRDQLIALAESLGSNILLLQFNQGAMPHEMFLNQIRRFSTEVLPDLRGHTVTKPLGD